MFLRKVDENYTKSNNFGWFSRKGDKIGWFFRKVGDIAGNQPYYTKSVCLYKTVYISKENMAKSSKS